MLAQEQIILGEGDSAYLSSKPELADFLRDGKQRMELEHH
jgi:hypothetical protein